MGPINADADAASPMHRIIVNVNHCQRQWTIVLNHATSHTTLACSMICFHSARFLFGTSKHTGTSAASNLRAMARGARPFGPVVAQAVTEAWGMRRQSSELALSSHLEPSCRDEKSFLPDPFHQACSQIQRVSWHVGVVGHAATCNARAALNGLRFEIKIKIH